MPQSQEQPQSVDVQEKTHEKDEDAMDIDEIPKTSTEQTIALSNNDRDRFEREKVAISKLRELTDDEIGSRDTHSLKAEIGQLEDKLRTLNPNLAAIDEYRDKARAFGDVVHEHDTASALAESHRKKYEELRKQRMDKFSEGFTHIKRKLAEMYQMITLEGGDADLDFVDSNDPFSEGILFRVRPPKKNWKAMSMLSGGEKTLSSLALVFALHHYKPTPIYIMDEIDAALDFKNVSIVANYIKQRTQNAQFLVISLRNFMFEIADRLVGIYKTDNQTKSVYIDPSDFKLPAPHLPSDGASEEGDD